MCLLSKLCREADRQLQEESNGHVVKAVERHTGTFSSASAFAIGFLRRRSESDQTPWQMATDAVFLIWEPKLKHLRPCAQKYEASDYNGGFGFLREKGSWRHEVKMQEDPNNNRGFASEWLFSRLYSRTTMLSCCSGNMQKAIKHCKAFRYYFNKPRKKKKKLFLTC